MVLASERLHVRHDRPPRAAPARVDGADYAPSRGRRDAARGQGGDRERRRDRHRRRRPRGDSPARGRRWSSPAAAPNRSRPSPTRSAAGAVAGDTADPEHVRAGRRHRASDAFGGLDVVVANAGLGFGGAAADVDDERWERTLDVNVTGAFRLARAAIPALLERGGGSIVLVSSVSGFVSGTESAAYGTSKAALLGLARSIAVDYGPRGIRANAVCPGWVVTPMGDRAMQTPRDRTRDLARRGLRPRDPAHPASATGHRRRDRGVLPVPRERRVVDRHRHDPRGRRRRAGDRPHRGRVPNRSARELRPFGTGRVHHRSGFGHRPGDRRSGSRREGAAVAVVDVRLDGAEETVAAIADAGGTGVAFDADVRDRSEVESARDGAVNAFGAHRLPREQRRPGPDVAARRARRGRVGPRARHEPQGDVPRDAGHRAGDRRRGRRRDREPRDDRVRGRGRLAPATRRCTTTRRRAA